MLKTLRKAILAAVTVTLASFVVRAQVPQTAQGTVIDSAGEPVIGATVLVKGTLKGTSTDIDGHFSLSPVRTGDVLQVSSIGYLPLEITWDGSPVNVTLQEDRLALEESVVVGYGVQKKVNVTGAVSMVDSDVLESRPVQTVSQALQGQIPGLNFSVTNGGGELNQNMSFNVRGTGTIGDGSTAAPLVLIDGIEGDMNTVNPNDIESISVLKDAASSSIYGARGAFGVILINTKSGKADTYWRALRRRAGVDEDYNKTIAATDLSKEDDWGKRSGETLVDATLFNIRRERRCEFIGEGFRWDDLIRWRSFDHLMTEKWIPEGVNLWGGDLYRNQAYMKVDAAGNPTQESAFIECGDNVSDANISARSDSKYVRPLRLRKENNELFDGYSWHKAYYLSPYGIQDLTLTSEDGTVENSVAYQNPYWPVKASEGALE